MKPPKGHSDYGKCYWRLYKAIYGLRQSGKEWNEEFIQYHCIWHLNLLNELNYEINNIEINTDNKAAIHNDENQTINPGIKHIDIRVHYIRVRKYNKK